jgi:hypothetical protein
MFLTVHAASGLVIGRFVKNPILAFLVAFIVHFLFDIIPHGDTKVDPKYKNPIHIATAGLIDVLVLICYLFFMVFNGVKFWQLNMICSFIGSILPDVLQALYYLYRKKWLKVCKNIHDSIHNFISAKYESNFPIGLIIQLIILIILSLIAI